jgi:5-methyltetrahydrofolate--homocysteine methyltransferase
MGTELLRVISENVLEGSVRGVTEATRRALEEGVEVREILNGGLIAGMDEVGALFKDGEMFVPEVLVSAKAMQAGLDMIRPLLAQSGVKSAGTVLTVTVEGDLHDIGVKLVGMMLEGAGFKVVNMGVDQTAKNIVEKVKEMKPDILGMSAMLTTTMANMKGTIELLREEGLLENLKIMVGGAPTSPAFAERIGAHYSADANEAVLLAKKLLGIN